MNTSLNVESAADSVPYAGLTPDCVLDALASVGLFGDGRLLGLNSYENRVYQVWLENFQDAGARAVPVVAKFYRPGRWTTAQILEEHELVFQLAAQELPVVAPLDREGSTLHEYAGFRFSVYPHQSGRAPEFDAGDTLTWMGRFIGRIHAIGALRPFVQRPALDIQSYGDEPRDWLLSKGFIPPELIQTWTSVVNQALDGIRRSYDRAGEVRLIRVHGDCHSGNVMWLTEGPDRGPHFVDFDDARMAPSVQDLWMLLSGDLHARTRQLRDLLSGYEDFQEFDSRELYLIEALRTLRLIHYSAWLARRWEDPAFPAAFPWFNTQRYWQDRILELREQVALMDELPLLQR